VTPSLLIPNWRFDKEEISNSTQWLIAETPYEIAVNRGIDEEVSVNKCIDGGCTTELIRGYDNTSCHRNVLPADMNS